MEHNNRIASSLATSSHNNRIASSLEISSHNNRIASSLAISSQPQCVCPFDPFRPLLLYTS